MSSRQVKLRAPRETRMMYDEPIRLSVYRETCQSTD